MISRGRVYGIIVLVFMLTVLGLKDFVATMLVIGMIRMVIYVIWQFMLTGEQKTLYVLRKEVRENRSKYE